MSLMEASRLHSKLSYMNKEHFLHHTMLACYSNFCMDQMWKKPFFCMHMLAMQRDALKVSGAQALAWLDVTKAVPTFFYFFQFGGPFLLN